MGESNGGTKARAGNRQVKSLGMKCIAAGVREQSHCGVELGSG